ncbi:MAG: phage Gp37/Gp68 family protein [Thermodesulfobacteriota bacterium]
MSKTKISWTDESWNPFGGCSAVSAGCANCYAKKNAKRLQGNPNTEKYRDGFQFKFYPEYLDQPLKWKTSRKIFVNTMSDTFHEDAPLEAIHQIFDRMVKCPQHIFQVLTKRAERMAELRVKLDWPENVWVGVTVENADYLHRLDLLRQVPARVRFISFEPLLSAIPNINFQDIHWAIVGGESGPKARAMDLDWARDIRDQCQRARIPFFFKQVGGKGRDKGGRHLDGKEWSEYPDAEPPAANPQKDKKVADTIKGTVVRGDTPFPWMVKGTVSHKSDGTCNVLVVVPHGHEGDDDNAEILGCHLAQFLGSYAVINNQKYRRPKRDDKGKLLEQPDLKKSLMDLNVLEDARKCDDYWNPILDYIKEINQKHGQEALVLLIHGMDDNKANELKPSPDIVIGKGFVGSYNSAFASASPEFFADLLKKLQLQKMGVVRDNVGRYSGESKLPAHVYQTRDKLGIKLQAVQVEVRYVGYRDEPNLEKSGYQFGEAIESLSHFKSWEDETMAATGKEAAKTTSGAVGMVDESKLNAIVDELRKRKTIRDDKGEEIDFTDALKKSLVTDVESAYPVLASALGNIYETGRFLFEVRERQKKNRLWMSFQEIVGMRKSATNNYIRVYDRFGDRLGEYGHLGVSKLQDVARLKDPFAFLESHKDEVEKSDVRSVTKMVRAEVDAKRKKRDKKEGRQLDVGSYRIEVSKNGRLLKIHNLNKDVRERLVEHLKEFLSQEK